MNLLLGYYVPYRHIVPLWELETDYWLHNAPTKSENGSLHTMRTYQRAFGVAWGDDNSADATESGTFDRSEILSPTLSQRAKLAKIRSRRSLAKRHVEDSQRTTSLEAKRVSKVRGRCTAQNDALSVWWKVAIQTNMQRRMWMQLGEAPSESMLPPRFERMYQPEKLSQFDRFFSRSWSTPVRRSHNDQHASSSESDLGTAFVKSISILPAPQKEESQEDQDETLGEFIAEYGYEPRQAPALKRFLSPYLPSRGSRDEASNAAQERGTSFLLTAISCRA